VSGLWFSPGTQVSSTNKIDCHDITEILLKVALNTINQTKIKLNNSKDLLWQPKKKQLMSVIYGTYIFTTHVISEQKTFFPFKQIKNKNFQQVFCIQDI
jgi:hypothetical protein